MTAAQARLWLQKWRWYERNSLPWNRARLHCELARRRVLRALAAPRQRARDAARGPPRARARTCCSSPTSGSPRRRRGGIRIGGGTFLNLGVHGRRGRASSRSASTACSPTAASSPTATTASTTRTARCTWQGFTSKGPTRIGDNVWCGANVVVTSGVTIGERCVIGANSVVTTDLPPRSIAAGAPARVLRTIDFVPGAEEDRRRPRPAELRRCGRPAGAGGYLLTMTSTPNDRRGPRTPRRRAPPARVGDGRRPCARRGAASPARTLPRITSEKASRHGERRQRARPRPARRAARRRWPRSRRQASAGRLGARVRRAAPEDRQREPDAGSRRPRAARARPSPKIDVTP